MFCAYVECQSACLNSYMWWFGAYSLAFRDPNCECMMEIMERY
jgi:hypothetical protein